MKSKTYGQIATSIICPDYSRELNTNQIAGIIIGAIIIVIFIVVAIILWIKRRAKIEREWTGINPLTLPTNSEFGITNNTTRERARIHSSNAPMFSQVNPTLQNIDDTENNRFEVLSDDTNNSIINPMPK